MNITRGFCRHMNWLIIVMCVSPCHSLDDYKVEDPPVTYSKTIHKPGNKITAEELPKPEEQCQMLNQVQSVVIQILSAHYEYGKGIHMLHSIADNLQKDIVVLKSSLSGLEKRQSVIENKATEVNITAQHADLFSPSKFLNELKPGRHDGQMKLLLKSGVLTLQKTIFNLTSTINQQASKMTTLEKKHKSLRRTVRRAVNAMEESKSKDQNPQETNEYMLEHFMAKQKDINGNILKRIMYLEEKWKRMSLQQGDSPHHHHLNNGCPNGFVRHYSSCYKFENVTKSWIEGEKHCQGIHPNSHLVSVETREEGDYLVKYRIHNNVKWNSIYVWTGGNDMSKEGKWTWVGTQQALMYTNWRTGEPNNHNDEQHCIYMRVDGADNRWDDWNCHAARLNIVCEINLIP